MVARYTPSGALDPSVDTGGVVTTQVTDVADNTAAASGVVIQPDRKIVVAGALRGSAAGTSHVMLARYTATGKLDRRFGSGGISSPPTPPMVTTMRTEQRARPTERLIDPLLPDPALLAGNGGRREVHCRREIVRKTDGQTGFRPLPKRWIIERTLAWISAHRRLARDYERDPASSATFVYWTMIRTRGPLPRPRQASRTLGQRHRELKPRNI